ncbi:MAG: TolB domain-containing protein [Bacillota bacterium]|nr:TolB domain-containing protein [Bacillota bacterium]
MKKVYISLLCFLILVSPQLTNAEKAIPTKLAFIRDGFLWVKIDNHEERITNETARFSAPPEWSYDSNWLLYQIETPTQNNIGVQNELWVYNMTTKKHVKIFYDGSNAKWSPVENLVAFQNGGVLNISDLHQFYNIALGVDDYNWFPDGQAFIASTAASLYPDGWTRPILYKINMEKSLKKNTNLTKNVKRLYVLPKELHKGAVKVFSINASTFRFSPDGKWISFLVSPTASLAMDSDMVCVISSNGKKFTPLDETIVGVDRPTWAYHQNLLGYISGGGRIVFGFKNKTMKVTELPAFQSTSLTPPHYTDLGFTWVDDKTLVVSRVREKEWSNNENQRPDAALYSLKVNEKDQMKISNPSFNFGDYQPRFMTSAKKITWLRQKDFASLTGDLWIADPTGKNAKVWVKNVESYNFDN